MKRTWLSRGNEVTAKAAKFDGGTAFLVKAGDAATTHNRDV